MYLKVKIKCDCGCKYELDSSFNPNSNAPCCPNCRKRLNATTLACISNILSEAAEIPEQDDQKITFSLKREIEVDLADFFLYFHS